MQAPTPAPTPAAAQAPAVPLLQAEALTLQHGERLIQRDIGFTLQGPEVLVVAGASGCGKSTLLRHLVGLQQPAAGRVMHRGVDFNAADEAEQARLRQGFGVMFQGGALWSSMSVGDNVMLPMVMFSRRSRRECAEAARERLDQVGLADAFDKMPAELSGGMKKRAALARALALQPPLLFLDEPSAGLDPLASTQLDALILQLREAGSAVVMVSHELDSIFAVADRLLFLDVRKQTMTALAPPQQLLELGPETVRQFLTRGGRS